MEFITKSAVDTQKLAGKLIKDLFGKRRGALVLALQGELGAGKTTFIQGLAKALKIKERVLSPTFVIMKRFEIRKLGNLEIENLYHIDCYRIEKPEDLLILGFEEIIKNSKNIVVIEWAEKIKSILPQSIIWIEFEHLGEDRRKIKITNHKTYNM
ncbi:tRNA (adenosine(37)-N6)-threonylcarbamoyltransferase complex ATPase subunit type 1 TsaE [Patescibacteria group bacterium]|nr:tRNA (adenosine(37)-N6)-threonylcarbamoyltransferase complex ATPase subunit type 1 TsaE [Patescibacteria group bacterium]